MHFNGNVALLHTIIPTDCTIITRCNTKFRKIIYIIVMNLCVLCAPVPLPVPVPVCVYVSNYFQFIECGNNIFGFENGNGCNNGRARLRCALSFYYI